MPKIVDHEARRRELSAIAAGLIAGGGMEAATIREIARSSGYSKGVIEHYFDNKDELISAALDWTNHCYEQRVEKSTASLTGIPALRTRIEVTLPTNKAIRNEWKVRMVFWSMAAIQDNLRPRQAERFNKAVEFYAEDIAEGITAGDIVAGADTLQLALSLFTSTIGISSMALYNPSLYDKTFLLGQIDSLMERLSQGY
jgi:AcrR family transcriptional regulator